MEQFLDSSVIYRAQMEASVIFSTVAVKVTWKSGHSCEAADVIHIHLSNQTSPSLKPGALARSGDPPPQDHWPYDIP
jgi:hypothetical protein